MDEALDAVKHLRLAEPSIGVRAILTRLRPKHPELDSRAIRDALLTPVTTPQPTLATTPPRTGRYLYGMPNTPEIVICLQGSGTSHSTVDASRAASCACVADVVSVSSRSQRSRMTDPSIVHATRW